jgi:competence protein ComEA
MCLVFAVIGVFAVGSIILAGNENSGSVSVNGMKTVSVTGTDESDPEGKTAKTENPGQDDGDDPDAGPGQEAESGTDRIYVYVCGEVISPGVYELEAGARAFEALEAAGGMTQEALAGAVNLAASLTDAQKLYIPSRAEADAYTVLHAPEEDSEDAVASGNASADGRININTATAAELTSLPGIGARRAADIIAYRTGNGGFSSPDQLKNVSGIGEAIYAGLADRICVSGTD